jgi:hypothetical protein
MKHGPITSSTKPPVVALARRAASDKGRTEVVRAASRHHLQGDTEVRKRWSDSSSTPAVEEVRSLLTVLLAMAYHTAVCAAT